MFIGYHILIKFFKNGSLENDWNKSDYRKYEKNAVEGDLQGIISELDYIKELGIDLIYLGPIFKCGTTHGYDITDYFKLATHISSANEDESIYVFNNLVSEAHKRGIKVIIDLVLNHASCYYEMESIPEGFRVKEEPPQTIQEERWKKLFKFWDISDKNTREFLIYVGEYWLKNTEIDGFRLDYALGVPYDFWKDFSLKMKEIKEDVILLGEVWDDLGSIEKNYDLMKSFIKKGNDYLFTNLFDFTVYGEIKNCINGKSPLKKLYDTIIHSYSLVNNKFAPVYFIENHDLPRFIDSCKNVDDFKIAMGIMLSLTGEIMLEYGNEIALKGDPDYPYPMENGRVAMKFKELWSEENRDIFKYIKKLIDLRKNNTELSDGYYHFINADKEYLEYEKIFKDKKIKILIILKEKTLHFEDKSEDLLTSKKFQGSMILQKGIYYII